MGEYQEMYPEAYGRGGTSDDDTPGQRFTSARVPQVAGDRAFVVERSCDTDKSPVLHRRDEEQRTVRVRVPARTSEEICDDACDRLAHGPLLEAAGIIVTVDGSKVELSGTIDSLIAISLAKALCAGIAGVSRVQVQLRVSRPPR